MSTSARKAAWSRRQRRVRSKVRGTADRPRLSVYRSLKHVYAQLIDDDDGRTLAAVSTLSPEFRDLGLASNGNVEAASKVGELVAAKAKALSIEQVVFDRNGFLYHGRVKAVADGARTGGLQF